MNKAMILTHLRSAVFIFVLSSGIVVLTIGDILDVCALKSCC